MKISFLFILILIIFAVFMFRGYRLGLIGILFGAVSWVFTILMIVLAGPFLAAFLKDNTGIGEAVYNYFSHNSGGNDIRTMIISQFAEGITSTIMSVLGAILAIALSLLIVFVAKQLLRATLNDKSAIGNPSRVAGTLWGLVEALVISWIILGICKVLLAGRTSGELFSDIYDNVLLSFLYNYNPLENVFF